MDQLSPCLGIPGDPGIPRSDSSPACMGLEAFPRGLGSWGCPGCPSLHWREVQ